MNLNLTSVRAKLARSAEHAQTIKNEFAAWGERNPYSVMQRVNADMTRYSVIFRVNEAPPIYRWSLMFADCLYALRCTLDHLVYTIACHESPSQPPRNEDRLMFPIADNRANFDKLVIDGKRLGDISDPVRAAIQSYQPYNRPHPELPPLISILRDLTNRDKHKLLPLVMSSVATGELGIRADIPAGEPEINERNPRLFLSKGEIEDGTEVCAITVDRPTPNMKFDKTLFNIVIAVRHGKRDPSLSDDKAWSDFASIAKFVSAEVREIIYEVSAKVR